MNTLCFVDKGRLEGETIDDEKLLLASATYFEDTVITFI
jgi:hypothetical protein